MSLRGRLWFLPLVSGPGTNFCVWKNPLLFYRFRLDLISLSPAREKEKDWDGSVHWENGGGQNDWMLISNICQRPGKQLHNPYCYIPGWLCLANKQDPAQFQCIQELGLAEVQESVPSDARTGSWWGNRIFFLFIYFWLHWVFAAVSALH